MWAGIETVAVRQALQRPRGRWLMFVAVVLAVVSVSVLRSQPSAAAPRSHVAQAPACEVQEALKGSELPELRTGTKRVFAHPCGGLVAEVTPQPVRFKDTGGRWRDIDTSLVSDGERLRNRAGTVHVELPKSLREAARVQRGDDWVAFALKGASGTAAVQGASATYSQALPDTTIRLAATRDGVKDDIVITGDRAPTSYVYELETSSGLTPQAKGGGMVFEDADGDAVASIAAPFMYGTDGAMSDKVSLKLRRGEGGDELVLEADPAWVRDHLDRGPVTIDPNVSFRPADPDCEIASGSGADTNMCSTSTLAMGVTNVNGTLRKRRSLLRFTIKRWLPKGSEIFDARLDLTPTKLPSTLTKVDLVEPTRAWNAGASWNRWGSNSTDTWTTPGGDYNATPVSTNAQVGDSLAAKESWDATALVRKWADSGNTNGGTGFLFKQADETSAQGDAEFASSEVANGPVLYIRYDNMTGDLPYYQFEQEEDLTDRLSMKVNVASGNLLLRDRELTVAGTGLDLNLDRYYNSREPVEYGTGWGWNQTPGGDVYLEQTSTGSMMFRGPSGYSRLFALQSGGTYKAPAGVEAVLTKGSDGLFSMKWNESGETWRFNASRKLVERADRNGRKLTFQYDTQGRFNKVTDTQGRVHTLTYNAAGRIGGLSDSAGRTRSYAYNATAPDAETNANALLVSTTDQAGKVTKYGYTGSLMTSVTDPLGNVTSFGYDDTRRITSVQRGGATTTYAYAQANTGCANDFNTVVTDPRGNKTTYCWERPGRVIKVIDAKGQTRAATYSASSKVKTSTKGSATSTFAYNATTDNLESGALPAGESFSLTYGDSANKYQPTESTNPQGTKTLFGYDANGNTTSVRDGASPAQSQATLEYNGQSGGVCPASGPSGTLRCAIDGKGNQTRYGYDTVGNLTTVTPPMPIAPTTMTYDSLSRLKSIKDGKGQTRTFTYDAMDRQTRIDYSDGASVATSYDANGNELQRVDSANGTWAYTYDAENRRKTDTLPGGTTHTYDYDPAGNLAKLTDRTGSVTYGYDAVNQLSELTEPDLTKTTFGYDDRDNRINTTFASGLVETRTYDTSDKVKTIRAVKGTAAPITDFTYTYQDAAGRQTQLMQTARDKNGDTTTYTYDGNDRLKQAQIKNTAGSVIDDRSYVLDAANNRTQQTINGTVTSFAYNAANQLCWKVGGASTAGCGSPPTGATTYTYDANGNQTGSSGGTSYGYNARNQTSSVTPAGGTAQAGAYGGDGQSELLKAGAKTFQNNLLGAGIMDGGPWGRADFVREPSGRLFSQTSSGRRHQYLYDGTDAIVAIASATGASGGYVKYGPYGEYRGQTGQDAEIYHYYRQSPNVFQAPWNGGNYKFGERYYNPNEGRWTQLDPIDSPADLRQANRYIYVGADPINLSDPSGLHSTAVGITCTIVGAAGGLAGTLATGGNPIGGFIGVSVASSACLAGASGDDDD